MKSSLKSLLASTALVLMPGLAAALTVSPTGDARDLVNTLFLNIGGISIQNFEIVSGELGQFGVYENDTGTYGLPITGIVLSSGNVSDYGSGPNESTGTSTSYANFDGPPVEDPEGPILEDVPVDVASVVFASEVSTSETTTPAQVGVATPEQNTLLQGITGRESHFDVADLVIDFVADEVTEMVTFFATFGSEEFPEFVDSSFVDGFGLFVNGVNVAASGFLPININHPDMREIAGTELDGILAPGGNPVLRFDVPVIAGQQNNFRIILADTSDSALDTTIYLSSFFATGGPDIGSTEFNPILPSNPPDPVTGAFIIDLPEDLQEFQLVWIDPPIAVGYTYDLNGGAFAQITAPSLATVADLDGYIITIGSDDYTLAAGATLDLLGLGLTDITSFQLTGIDEALMLDPANALAFPLGVALHSLTGGPLSIIQTPITVDIGGPTPPAAIPLPAAGWMLLAGLGGLAAMRRRRVRA